MYMIWLSIVSLREEIINLTNFTIHTSISLKNKFCVGFTKKLLKLLIFGIRFHDMQLFFTYKTYLDKGCLFGNFVLLYLANYNSTSGNSMQSTVQPIHAKMSLWFCTKTLQRKCLRDWMLNYLKEINFPWNHLVVGKLSLWHFTAQKIMSSISHVCNFATNTWWNCFLWMQRIGFLLFCGEKNFLMHV